MFGLSIKTNPDSKFYEVTSGGASYLGFAIDPSDAIRRCKDELRAGLGKRAEVSEVEEHFDREELPFSVAGFINDEATETVTEPPAESDPEDTDVFEPDLEF